MKNKRLLLVDDETSILLSFAKALRTENYQVTTASNGDEAIQALMADAFNLVVTDLVMPGPSGIEVLREAKKQQPEIGVIVLTGYGDLTSAVEALRLGADDYLLKPLDIDDLLTRLAELLDKQVNLQKSRQSANIIMLCAYCQDVRDKNAQTGEWDWIHWEKYLTRKNNVTLSHGCCPVCFEKLRIEWQL